MACHFTEQIVAQDRKVHILTLLARNWQSHNWKLVDLSPELLPADHFEAGRLWPDD